MKQAGRIFLITMLLVFVAGQPVLGGEAGASLHDLQLSEGPPEAGFMGQALAGKLPEGKLSLTPAFEPAVDTYTVTVSQPLLTIRARAAAGVKMSVSGTAPGGDELRVANQFGIGNANDHGAFMSATMSELAAGENVMTVTVSDSSGSSTRSYTVTVTRIATADKAPVDLDDLQLSEGAPKPGFMFNALAGKLPEGDLTVTPAFEPQVTSYAANVSQPLLTVRARAAAGVEIRVTGTAAGGDELTTGNRSRVSNASGHGTFLSITLSGLTAGENLVTVEVTDPDGAETRGYKVVLTRVAQSAGDTARSAQTTKALQAPEAVRPGPEAARQARDERLQEREKARQARREARQAREEARKARREARRAGQTDASSDQKGQDLLSSFRYKDADGVRRAIEAGENVNEIIPGKTGVSPLLLAVDKEDTEIVRLLIDAGADVNHILPKQGFQSNSSTGISALLLAVNKGYDAIVRLLIDAGADVNYVLPKQGFPSKNATGTSALLVAVKKGNEEILQALIEAGADVNYSLPKQDFQSDSISGLSALLLAVSERNEANVRLLIEAGADVSYQIPGKRRMGKNPKTAGLTALRVAKAKDHSGIAELLRKAGAKR